jgi:hypothetical protein
MPACTCSRTWSSPRWWTATTSPCPPASPGEKLLVTVLFGRTQPLIRYELSDTITSSDRLRCPCGRPFALIEGIQGRIEEALSLPARSGGQITVQPAVLHGVMDGVPAEGWQLVQEPERLAVLLAGVPDAFDDDALADRLRRDLRSRGALPPPVHVQRVRAIPPHRAGQGPTHQAKHLTTNEKAVPGRPWSAGELGSTNRAAERPNHLTWSAERPRPDRSAAAHLLAEVLAWRCPAARRRTAPSAILRLSDVGSAAQLGQQLEPVGQLLSGHGKVWCRVDGMCHKCG